jgi:hypothetical protein
MTLFECVHSIEQCCVNEHICMCAGKSGSQIMYTFCRQTGYISKSNWNFVKVHWNFPNMVAALWFFICWSVCTVHLRTSVFHWRVCFYLLWFMWAKVRFDSPTSALRAWRECMLGMGPFCAEGHLSFAQRILYLLSTDVCSHISPPARGWWWWVGITGTVHWNVKHTQPLRGWQEAPLLNRDCVVQQPRLSSSPTARCQNNQ